MCILKVFNVFTLCHKLIKEQINILTQNVAKPLWENDQKFTMDLNKYKEFENIIL